MFVMLTASREGFSASLLRGTDRHWGRRTTPTADDAAQGSPRVVDVRAERVDGSTSGTRRTSVPTALKQESVPLVYAAPRTPGQAPALLAAAPPPGTHLDIYA